VRRGLPGPVDRLGRSVRSSMTISRRDALLTTLFGAGCVGLRSLATGLPAWFLLDPSAALAAPPAPACTAPPDRAQFIVFSTSGTGDPLNANAPGTYDDP